MLKCIKQLFEKRELTKDFMKILNPKGNVSQYICLQADEMNLYVLYNTLKNYFSISAINSCI